MSDELDQTQVTMPASEFRKMLRVEMANGKRGVGFAPSTWVGIVSIGVITVMAIAALMVFIFATNSDVGAAVIAHQTAGHPTQIVVNKHVKDRLEKHERKIEATVHNTIKIGERLRVQDLKTGDETP